MNETAINEEMIDTAYVQYLNMVHGSENAREAAVSELARKLEGTKLTREQIELSADYEESARRAAFFAGYTAAVSRVAGMEDMF